MVNIHASESPKSVLWYWSFTFRARKTRSLMICQYVSVWCHFPSMETLHLHQSWCLIKSLTETHCKDYWILLSSNSKSSIQKNWSKLQVRSERKWIHIHLFEWIAIVLQILTPKPVFCYLVLLLCLRKQHNTSKSCSLSEYILVI